MRESPAEPRLQRPLGLQHRGGNYDPLLHPIAAHRDERHRAWKLQKFLNIRHAQAAEDYLTRTRPVNMFLLTSR